MNTYTYTYNESSSFCIATLESDGLETFSKEIRNTWDAKGNPHHGFVFDMMTKTKYGY